ncbi:UNVERIFIED_CONTAM: hypothetical protein GTU68_054215 [Idotea baltica]|nr:hypothetical protein [Idotea baltica]
MAGNIRILSSNLCKPLQFQSILRCLGTSSSQQNKDSWLDKLLVRKIEPTKESHSRMLSDKEIIYELQTHNIRPGTLEPYLKNYENYVRTVDQRNLTLELCGSWTVGVGDQDQCLHLWRYEGGYTTVDKIRQQFVEDSEISKLVNDRNQYLRQRVNQYLLAFSFWPQVTKREGKNIYEIRSYHLKPGTMIEWGNNWARAIQFRQSNNEAYGGFFSQVGRLYNVHHIWCYESLKERKRSREDVWRHPGWDEVVAYTVPLIKEMHTRFLIPNSFSPSQ